MSSNLLFIVFLAAIAIYVLYAAITGKGKLYNNEFIKEELKAKFHKFLRLCYTALGVFMLLETATMVGQQYLFVDYGYHFTESYYEQDGTFHEVTEQDDIYYDNGHEIDTFSYDQFIEKYFILNEAGNPISMTVTKHDPTDPEASAEAAKIEAAANSTAASCMSMGNSSQQQSIYPAAKSSGKMHKSETIFSGISYKAFEIMNYVFMGLALISLVGVFVITRKFTDKEKRQKAQTYNTGAKGMPRSAFNFEDDKE